MKHKKEIRNEIIKKRENFKKIDELNELIYKKILSFSLFLKRKKIGLYYSINNEVNTHKLIEEYINLKKIALPKIENKKLNFYYISSLSQLFEGKYNILEPISNEKVYDVNELEIIFIPGVAFDTKGNRIGMGKGYYDRILKNFNHLKIGLAYEFQIFNKIPYEKHDIKMDYIISEKRIIKCN